MRRSSWLSFLTTALAFGLCGCASHMQSPDPVKGPVKIVGDTEYEYVYVTGSNIPVKVPKSPTAHPLPTATPLQLMSPEEFREVVHRGQR